MNNWAPILGPLATLTVGIGVLFVAWQQWQLARSKMRLDLFDRRYKVYDATRKFLLEILRSAGFEDSHLFEFNAGTSDAGFLFGQEVVDYTAEIRRRAADMKMHQHIFAPMPVGEERSRHVQAEHDQLVWLGEQLTAMNKIFIPYLGFSHVK